MSSGTPIYGPSLAPTPRKLSPFISFTKGLFHLLISLLRIAFHLLVFFFIPFLNLPSESIILKPPPPTRKVRNPKMHSAQSEESLKPSTKPLNLRGLCALPAEIHLLISETLEIQDVLNISIASKTLNSLYTPSIYTAVVDHALSETKRFFHCEMHWRGDYHTKYTRKLSQQGTCGQIKMFLDIFEVKAPKILFDVGPGKKPFTSDPVIRIPLAILRTALDPDFLRTEVIQYLSKRLGKRMNQPGWTPVQSLLEHPSFIPAKIGDLLIKNGMDINILYDGFTRPVQTAILNNQVETVKWFVRNGANVHKADRFEWTPVNTVVGSMWSRADRDDVLQDKAHLLKFLVWDAGADVNGKPGRLNVFKQLHDQVTFWMRGMNSSSRLPDPTRKETRVLNYALPALIKLKANPNVFESPVFAGGPLHWVVDWRHKFDDVSREGLIKSLLQLGADIELRDENGETPLLKALNSRKPQLLDPAIKTLIRSGASIHMFDRRGETALEIARRRRRRDIVEVMRQANPGDYSVTQVASDSD